MKFCTHIGTGGILVPAKFCRPMLIIRLVISPKSEKVENRDVRNIDTSSGPTKHRTKAINGAFDSPSLLVVPFGTFVAEKFA